MPDVFHWKNDTPDAITLYFYATIMRLSYYSASPLWSLLVREYGGLEDVLHFTWETDVSSGWSVLYGRNGTIVIFEGTRNFFIQGVPQIQQATDYFVPIEEHAFYPGRVSLFGRERIAEIYTTKLHQAVSNGNFDTLTTCGHSLGGQLAQLAAVRLKNDFLFDFQGVITLGSTKVGDDVFAQNIGTRVVRIENRGDPVPLWPYNHAFQGIRFPDSWQGFNVQIWQHAGRQYLLTADSHLTINQGSTGFTGLNFDQVGESGPHPQAIPQTIYVAPWWPHNTEEYCRRLRNRLFHDSLLTQLNRRERWVLDRINVAINAIEGIDWKLNVETGWPTDWIINPNLPPPRCGCHR